MLRSPSRSAFGLTSGTGCSIIRGLGWILVIALAVATAVLGQVVYHQSRQHVGLASENDERLLVEWLDGWRQGSDFMLWLDTNYTSVYLPAGAVRSIERRLDAWASDKRTLNDLELAKLFEAWLPLRDSSAMPRGRRGRTTRASWRSPRSGRANSMSAITGRSRR